jgi:hypothetical protein
MKRSKDLEETRCSKREKLDHDSKPEPKNLPDVVTSNTTVYQAKDSSSKNVVVEPVTSEAESVIEPTISIQASGTDEAFTEMQRITLPDKAAEQRLILPDIFLKEVTSNLVPELSFLPDEARRITAEQRLIALDLPNPALVESSNPDVRQLSQEMIEISDVESNLKLLKRSVSFCAKSLGSCACLNVTFCAQG